MRRNTVLVEWHNVGMVNLILEVVRYSNKEKYMVYDLLLCQG